jgi:hypothetical protein
MTVLITLTTAGADSGPFFDLYSNVDGYSVPFETGVSKSALVAGYMSSSVPNGTTIVRVYSNGLCVNYIDLTITTTTTTTQPPTGNCYYYDAIVAVNDLQNSQDGMVHFVYVDCNGDPQQIALSEEGTWTNAFCGTGYTGSYYVNQSNINVEGLSYAEGTLELCNTTTTTTTIAPTYTELADSRWSSISQAAVCSNFPGTLYSNCVAMEANEGCILYTDQNGTILQGYPYVYLQALGAFGNWDVNPTTGEVINYSPNQC